jgi:hypothetical protein
MDDVVERILIARDTITVVGASGAPAQPVSTGDTASR